MENHDAPELAAEVVSTELEQCLTGGRKQQAQEEPWIAQDEGIEGVGQRKDGVKVRDREEFSMAIGHPLRFGKALTLIVPVT
jgi:hypothetical protein